MPLIWTGENFREIKKWLISDDFEEFISYDNLGHLKINGSFQTNSILNNKLIFEFISDQSYISETLKNFQPIINKYGDNYGIKK